MKKAVMCIVQNQTQADSIVGQLQGAGFANNDISVLFPNKSGTKDFAHEHNTKAPEGAVAGAGAGGVVGGTLGLLAGIGALAIPGVAKRYEGKIKGGNILISVHTETSDKQKRAEAIFKTAHAEDICSTGEASVPTKKEARAQL